MRTIQTSINEIRMMLIDIEKQIEDVETKSSYLLLMMSCDGARRSFKQIEEYVCKIKNNGHGKETIVEYDENNSSINITFGNNIYNYVDERKKSTN